ncbi:MAG: type IV pilus assembly protein PilM [Candidatus Saccharibacteria bacterium]
MFNLFNDKRISAFGLDLSDSSIKVMQLERKNGIVLPRAYSSGPVPTGVIANHQIAQMDKLADIIRYAVSAARNVNTKYVVASVPETKSFVRVLTVPKMEQTEIADALPWELEQDIPVPIDQVYMDWQMIRETDDKYEVLVTATPRDYADAIIDTLKSAGYTPVALELESQATARALIKPGNTAGAVLLADISGAMTSFVIVADGNILEYTSSIPIGGGSFTESIARSLGVSQSEAEKMKREKGLLSETKKGNIRQALLPILDNIVDEIKSVVRFYEEHAAPGQGIDRVLLCGGGSKLSGIADYISARLNLGADKPIGRVQLGDAGMNLFGDAAGKQPAKEDFLSYTTAIGLALRGLDYEID